VTFSVEYFSELFTTSYLSCMHLFILFHIILFLSTPSKILPGMKIFQWDVTVIWIWLTPFLFQEAQMLIWSTLDVVGSQSSISSVSMALIIHWFCRPLSRWTNTVVRKCCCCP